MNYNDNGEIKKIAVKAGDTLPVGTIIESDTSTIPNGYAKVDDLSLDGVDNKIGELSLLDTENKSNVVEAINEVNNKFDYSTNEQRIGKWVDGKPLYRKTFSGTGFRDSLILGPIENLKDVINTYGIARSIYNNRWPIPNVHEETGYNINFNISVNNDIIFNAGSYYNGSPTCAYCFTIEYTKTTD